MPVKKIARGKSNWHGVKNSKLIKANLVPFTKQQVKQTFNDIFPKTDFSRGLQGKEVTIKEPLPPLYTKQHLKKEKDFYNSWSEITGNSLDWEGFKRKELGINKKVSDYTFIEFKNKKHNEIVEKYHPKAENDF